MRYVRFSAVFVFIYMMAIVSIMQKVDANLYEKIFIGSAMFFMGTIAISLFFYTNKEAFHEYIKSPSRHLLMKIVFRRERTKNGENSDA